MLEKQLLDAPHDNARAALRKEIKIMCQQTAIQWAAYFPNWHWFAFDFGANQHYMKWSPWQVSKQASLREIY